MPEVKSQFDKIGLIAVDSPPAGPTSAIRQIGDRAMGPDRATGRRAHAAILGERA